MKRVLFVSLLLGGCGETGQARIDMPLLVTGTAPAALEVPGGTLEITRAEVGFGPLYLCATTSAELDLCPVAVAEVTASVTIDALDPEARSVAEVHGVTGMVRSATFDYGISYSLTASEPLPTEGAPEGHSLVLEGTLTRGEERFEIHALVDVSPRNAGDSAVRGAPVVAQLDASTRSLVAHADVSDWLMGLDLEAIEPVDGRIDIVEGTTAYDTIVLSMTARAPIDLRFEAEP